MADMTCNECHGTGALPKRLEHTVVGGGVREYDFSEICPVCVGVGSITINMLGERGCVMTDESQLIQIAAIIEDEILYVRQNALCKPVLDSMVERGLFEIVPHEDHGVTAYKLTALGWEAYRKQRAVEQAANDPLGRSPEQEYLPVIMLPLPLVSRHAGWSQATFGRDTVVGPIKPLRHICKEAIEAVHAWNQHPGSELFRNAAWLDAYLEELADIAFLFIDAMRRSGVNNAMLVAAMEKKMPVLESRTWANPEDKTEPSQHIEEPENET